MVGIILTKVSLVVVGVHERFFEFLIYRDTGVGFWGTANELFTIAAGLKSTHKVRTQTVRFN